MDQIIFLGFILIFVAHGFIRTKSDVITNERDFALSKSGTSWASMAAGISMTFVGGAATLNMSSLGYQFGWQAFIDPVSVIIGLSIALLLVQKYRTGQGVTFASLITHCDRSSTLFFGAVTFSVYILLVASQFVALGKLCAVVFPDIDARLLILLPSFLVCLYVFLNGFSAVNKTDVLQYVLMCLFLVAPFAIYFFGYTPTGVTRSNTTNFLSMPVNLALLLSFAILFIPLSQDVVLRVKAARTERDARIGLAIGAASYLLFVGCSIGTGMILKTSGVILSDSEIALPVFFKQMGGLWPIAANIAVLAAIMSTLDAMLLSSIVTFQNDLLKPAFKSIEYNTHDRDKRIAIIIVFLLAALIATIFQVILGLILIGLMIYVSVLAPAALGKYLNLTSKQVTLTSLVLIAIVMVIELSKIDVSAKVLVYPSIHLAMIIVLVAAHRIHPKSTA